MKTNHRRGFKARNDKPTNFRKLISSMPITEGEPRLGGSVGAHDQGHHGLAHEKHGLKKFIHTRERRRADAKLKKELDEL